MRGVSLEADQEPVTPHPEEAQRAPPLEVSAEGAGKKRLHRQRFVLDESPKGMPRPRRVNVAIRIENSKSAALVFGFPG
jgi:hypothetical protein